MDDFFKKKKPEPKEEKPGMDPTFLSNQSRRMRIVEERVLNLNKKLDIIEENMLEFDKNTKEKINDITSNLDQLKNEFLKMRDTMGHVVTEIENKANESEFAIFKRYLEMWKPITFVSRGEVKDMIEKHLKKE